MPIDIDKKEFSRDKKGYNSREVDEFLDLIAVDYEKVLNDNRAMAHKIKSLEKQLEEASKSDTAMVETLETAKKLMADISASAERRAELMMRDAELEAENMMLEAKVTVRKLNEEHAVLKNKVERLRGNYKTMLENELKRLAVDEYSLLPDLDITEEEEKPVAAEKKAPATATIVVAEENKVAPEDDFIAEMDKMLAGGVVAAAEPAVIELKDEDVNPVPPVKDLAHATISDLSESLKRMAEEPVSLNDTIILK